MRGRDGVAVIDIFAGPGGLGEGFSSFLDARGERPFRIGLSAEMEPSAHSTLRLRAFVRRLIESVGDFPRPYVRFLERLVEGRVASAEEEFGSGAHSSLWKEAAHEALNL